MAFDWPTQLHIDGQWSDGAAGGTWSVMNPATGTALARVAIADATDVDRTVRAARRAFDEGPWPRMEPLERGRLLYKLAE
jgi:acyl-CoA reductase-like NAD-dependent aldehyde dehydrogenase